MMRDLPRKTEISLLKGNSEDIHQYIMVNNSSLYHEFRNFIVDHRAWNLNTEISEWPTAKFNTTGTLKAVVQLRPDPDESLNDEQLIHWRDRVAFFISKMNDLTADCLDIICAIWLDRTKSPEGMVIIKANDFLSYRDIKKRGEGGYQVNQKRDIEEQIRLLSNLWINVFEMTVTEEVKNKKGTLKRQRIKKYSMRSRAIVLSSIAEEETSDGNSTYFWKMRPGDVFLPFLLGPGRQLAFISKKILKYHVKKQIYEKRIARYLGWIWRIRAVSSEYHQPFTVKTLLEASSLLISPRNPIRTKERLENCLDKLLDDELISAWQYKEDDVNEAIILKKGWVTKWTQWRIFIEPPSIIMDSYKNISNSLVTSQKRVSKESIPISDFSNDIREIRKKYKLTQLQLAEKLGISGN